MIQIDILIWFFPLLFIFHDFEEIIFMEYWMKRNSNKVVILFPKIGNKIISNLADIHTASFSAGVAEEFILICIITVIAYFTKNYNLWSGIFIAFIIHLIMHIAQGIIYKGYIPALVTSIFCLPVSLWIVREVIMQSNIKNLLLVVLVGILIMVANLALIHKLMKPLNKWLQG